MTTAPGPMTASSVPRRRAQDVLGAVSKERTRPNAPTMSPAWARSSRDRRSAGGPNGTSTRSGRGRSDPPSPTLPGSPLRVPPPTTALHLVLRVAPCLVEQCSDVLVVERVDAEPADALAMNKVVVTQDPQLV